MLFAIALILLLTAASFVLTYFLDEDAPLWARAAMGAVIGQALFGTIGFVVASFAGMSIGTVLFSTLLCLTPLLLLRRASIRKKFDVDVSAFQREIKSYWRELPLDKSLSVALYVALFALLWYFFERAMIVKPDGIFIGSTNNLGDLPFHLQGIYSFTDGQNFPPENPSYAGSKFTYPFIVNLAVAMLIKMGAAVQDALFWQNITLAFSLVGIFHYFTYKLTGSRAAAHIAPLLFLFSGGIGFIMFFYDAVKSEQGVFGLLMNLQKDYTLRPESTWRWGNTLTVLMITQRSMLIGLPFTLVILNGLWNLFKNSKEKLPEAKTYFYNFSFSPVSLIILGLLAGLLPLVHAHSYAVLMATAACLALINIKNWREWALFFAAALFISGLELLWATTGSANRAESFVAWQFGWDKGESNVIWFWLKNTGLFIPLLIAAIALLIREQWRTESGEPKENIELEDKSSNWKASNKNQTLRPGRLLLFWLPFALCFIVPNMVRLAPWVWDNIKVLIYWLLLSVPLVAWLLAWIWRRGQIGKIAATSLILILTLSGFLDVWRVASGAFEYSVFDKDAVKVARLLRERTPPRSLIMSAPMYNAPVVLTGRRWFMGYTGHLASHGIDFSPRENDLRRIYSGTPDALDLIRKNGIDYVIVSPMETDAVDVNESFFQRFPIVAEAGAYRVYQVRQ